MTKTVPFQHQIEDTATLVKHPAFAIFSEMGTGKSKIVIDAACQLAEQGKIDTVVIVAPASVRCVWLDKELGEIKKHSWMPNHVIEFHSRVRGIWHDVTIGKTDLHAPILKWVVTNYEFLRSARQLEALCLELDECKVLLVLDESSYIKSRSAQQTKAVAKLRKHCARCVILNGTPITNSPLDVWSQFNVLDPTILEKRFKNFYHFRSEYCEMQNMQMGLRRFPVVKAYRRLDKLAKILAPYVLRREKKDCLDLPPKLYTEREVALSPESWKRYQELKRECVVSLGGGEQRLEPNAAVRIMRLAQLTSGILGSNSGSYIEIEGSPNDPKSILSSQYESCTQDISDEKLKWCVQYLTEECTAQAVICWTRWRRERERLAEALKMKGINAQQIYGGQPKAERELAIKVMSQASGGADAETWGKHRICIAQPHAGGHGLNLVAASEAIYMSNDFALGIRLQSEDRMHRPGQFNPCTYIDVLATGPKGERTIDHIIFKALREKKSVADLTCNEWRSELDGE